MEISNERISSKISFEPLLSSTQVSRCGHADDGITKYSTVSVSTVPSQCLSVSVSGICFKMASMFRVSLCFLMLHVASAKQVTIRVAGDPINVWAAVDTYHKCHIIDVPDIPARAFVDNKGRTHMIVGATQYHHMSGSSVLNVTRDCAVAYNETGDPNPANFAGDEFLDSSYSFGNGTVISLVHTEYPGNVYNNCTGPSYPHCWTVTIGLGVSHDWGATWKHARPPPHHLVAAVPYQYNQSQLAYGWGDPSSIVKSPKDGYYYVAMWNRNQVGLQAPGICIARTKTLLDPSSWRGWNGHEFSVTFASPYTLTPGTEADHVCTVVNLPAPNCAALGMVWSDYTKTFIVTLGCFGAQGRDFYFAWSDDLIHWSDAQPFYSAKDLPANVSKVVVNINYPTFMDPTAPEAFNDPNFETIGQHPYLFWVSMGHSPETDGRHLWATPMKFEVTEE